MLFKMLGIEQAVRAECDEDAPRPRQLFVTQSRVLAEKVEEFYRKLVMEQNASRRTARESTKLAAKHRNWEDEALVDEDEEELYRGTLPRFFSELTDDHFPLFITFDHVSILAHSNEYSTHPLAMPSSADCSKQIRTVSAVNGTIVRSTHKTSQKVRPTILPNTCFSVASLLFRILRSSKITGVIFHKT